MIIFGSRATTIGSFSVPDTKCGYCQNDSTQQISVFGKYFHIFWIPVFPIGKTAVAECKHCKRTIEQKEFSKPLLKLYWDNSSKAKAPFWHWIGLILVGGLFALISLIGITTEDDPRSKFLDKDISAMTSSPTMESDSVSYRIKEFLGQVVNEEIQPEEFEYLTKIKDDKALILIKIPKLKKVEKNERTEVLKMVEMIADKLPVLNDKEKYIGVHGAISMMLVKTPTYEDNSKLASTTALLDYYGAKPK